MKRCLATRELTIVFLLVAAVQTASLAKDCTIPVRKDDTNGVACHTRYLDKVQKGDCDLLLIGDSVTGGWNEDKRLSYLQAYCGSSKIMNLGVGGDMVQNVLWRLGNGELEHIKPKAIMLLIGINNTGKDTPEEISNGIQAVLQLIKQKQPQAKVLLLGIFPPDIPSVKDRVTKTNQLISKFDDGKNVRFLDIGEKLAPGGVISQTVYNGPIHLKSPGYEIWAEAVKPMVLELLGNGSQN